MNTSPASLAPVAGLAFPMFGLSVSKKNDHFSVKLPPNRMRNRRTNRFVDVAV